MIGLRLIATAVMVLTLLSAFPVVADKAAMGPRLADAEHVYRTDGPAAALPVFEHLLGIFESTDKQHGVAVAHGFIGACHWRLGNYDQARQHLDRSLALSREFGDLLQEGKALNLLGLLEWDLGDFDAAIENFTRASAIGEQAGDAKLHGATLNNLSLVYDELGDYRTSLDQYHRVLDIYSEADFPRGEGDTLGNIGGVYLLLGRFTDAERYYRQALQISEELESVAGMSQDHGNLGLAQTGMGDVQQALLHFDRALALAEQGGLRKEQGQWLRGRANAQVLAGRYDLGLEDHRAALEKLEEVGAQAQLLDALHDMGELLLMLGDPVSAEQYFQRGMTLARGLDMPRVVTLNLLSLGDIQFRHRRLESAAALYAQALQRAAEAGERTFQGWALMRMARVHRDQDARDEGMRAAQRALEIAREVGARSIECEALFMQAEFHRIQGATETALRVYSDAGRIAAEVGDPELQWQVEFGRALALEQAGRIEDAVGALQIAVEVIEGVRSRLREKRYQSGYLQDRHLVYIELVRLQMKLSLTRDAFATAERLRTWSYVEQAGPAGGVGLTADQQRLRFELRERIRQLQRNLDDERARSPPDRRQLAIDTFSTELLLAEREFQALLDDTGDGPGDPENGLTRLGAAAVQRHLLPDEALLEYVVGANTVTLFVLTAERLHAKAIPASRNNLHSRLELLRNLLQQRHNDRWKEPARSLADTLLKPVLESGWLTGIEHLYLVPHGMLNYMPFALLPVAAGSGRQTVVERYTLAYLPAASLLVDAAAGGPRVRNLLAMAPAASRLAHAPEEVRSIGALFGADAELLVGSQATESTFKSSAGEYGILHLATHGYFNKLNPLLSGLQLEADAANDGLLEVHEILELDLHSDLVTLSACKTGLGSGYFAAIPAGDDFVGMTRAFLQVGSASVLATLWEVEDRSTVDLMRSFYGHLDAGHEALGQAGALANAQRTLIGSPTYEHPYYWAPFVLVGSMSSHRRARG